jgi:hypothetical protein
MRDTIDMAREAGILGEFDTAQDIIECGIEVWLSGERGVQTLERFAALVASAEREACAKVCYELPWKDMGHIPSNLAFAAAIRARGNT